MTGPANSEERMIAYLDGELDDDEMLAFEEQMADDPALAEEVGRLMANDDLLRGAFDSPMSEVADEALLARMGLALAEAPDAEAPRHQREPAPANDNRPFLQRWAVPLGGALAATLAAVAVFAPGSGPAGTGFDRAMSETRSLQVASLDSGAELTPLLTFQAADGTYCREFSIARPGSAGGSGVACNRGGSWQVEALESGAVELAGPDDIRLASGQDGESLEATYERLGAGDPLDAASESVLIGSDWQDR